AAINMRSKGLAMVSEAERRQSAAWADSAVLSAYRNWMGSDHHWHLPRPSTIRWTRIRRSQGKLAPGGRESRPTVPDKVGETTLVFEVADVHALVPWPCSLAEEGLKRGEVVMGWDFDEIEYVVIKPESEMVVPRILVSAWFEEATGARTVRPIYTLPL